MELDEFIAKSRNWQDTKRVQEECLKIYELLKIDPNTSNKQIAQTLGWSSGQVHNRKTKLKEMGYIKLVKCWQIINK